MGLFTLIGGLLGAGAQKKASRKAQAAMIDALNRGIDTQQHQYDQTREDFAPYTAAGTAAMGGLGDLTGINGNDKWTAALSQLERSPELQSLYRTGDEAILQNASATGGLRGGNTQRSLADFRSDTFAKMIQQQLANLGGIAGLGLGATGSVAGFGQNTANNVSGMQTGIGQTTAGGITTRGGITAGMWNNAGSFIDQAIAAAMGAGAGPGGAPFNFGKFAKVVF
jgi:hypothetical protein